MASLFEEDLHSSDSEDDDYVPNPGEISSEDEDEGDPLLPEQDDEIKTKKRSKKNREKLVSEDEKNKILEESSSLGNKVDEKQRANDLFKNFLEEVEAEMKVKEPSLVISLGSNPDSPGVFSINSDLKGKGNENIAEKPCEIFEFAGETVAVSMKDGTKISSAEKSADSDLGKNAPEKPEIKPPVVKRKGLQSVLGTILNKKQKLSTLEKTSLDWNSFKKEHAISEELETYNKGRGGYIERQRFLQRSDVRSYEIERDLRLSKSKKKL